MSIAELSVSGDAAVGAYVVREIRVVGESLALVAPAWSELGNTHGDLSSLGSCGDQRV